MPKSLTDVLTIDDISLPGPEWWLFTASAQGAVDLAPAFARALSDGARDSVYLAPSLLATPAAHKLTFTADALPPPGSPLVIRFPADGPSPTILASTAKPADDAIVTDAYDLGPVPPPFIDFSSHHSSTATWHVDRDLGLSALRHVREYEDTLARYATRSDGEAARRLRTFDNGVSIPPLARALAAGTSEADRAAFGSPYRAGTGSFYEAIRAGEGRIPVAGPLWLAAWDARPDVREAFPHPRGKDIEPFLAWCATGGRVEHQMPGELTPPLVRGPVDRNEGANIVGLLSSDAGQGSAARGLAHALTVAGVQVAGLTVAHNEAAAPGIAQLLVEGSAPHSTNVFVTSGSTTGEVMARLLGHLSPGHRNVAYWMWETERLPDTWASWASSYDEIWAASRYVADAIRHTTGIDPVVIPHAIEPRQPGLDRIDRARLGVPEDATVFLFMFDYLSRIERKNPLGLIEAFRRAFGNDPGAWLLLKSSRASYDAAGRARVEDAAAGLTNVRLLDAVFTTPDPLYNVADCYVSLHRSEGFGLTMAEAMAAGKPVIATGYSGNLDFTPPGSAHLVPYELHEIPRQCGPYPAGDHWAEPDLDAAAALMRQVFEDRDEAAALGQRGRAAVEDVLDPVKIGTIVRERIRILSRTP